MDKMINDPISENKKEFEAFDDAVWQKTSFNEKTGGYVITEIKRIPDDTANPNIKAVFSKEQSMCLDLAGFGFCIKHLYECPGISSADISINRGLHSIIEINGKTADLKELNKSNNIRKEAKDTFEKKQKADLIVFKFKSHDRQIAHEISKLNAKGWHGLYYYENEKIKNDF